MARQLFEWAPAPVLSKEQKEKKNKAKVQGNDEEDISWTNDRLQKLRVFELKRMCKKIGLRCSGRKYNLVPRLADYFAQKRRIAQDMQQGMEGVEQEEEEEEEDDEVSETEEEPEYAMQDDAPSLDATSEFVAPKGFAVLRDLCKGKLLEGHALYEYQLASLRWMVELEDRVRKGQVLSLNSAHDLMWLGGFVDTSYRYARYAQGDLPPSDGKLPRFKTPTRPIHNMLMFDGQNKPNTVEKCGLFRAPNSSWVPARHFSFQGGVLADEMGLGKTLVMIRVLSSSGFCSVTLSLLPPLVRLVGVLLTGFARCSLHTDYGLSHRVQPPRLGR